MMSMPVCMCVDKAKLGKGEQPRARKRYKPGQRESVIRQPASHTHECTHTHTHTPDPTPKSLDFYGPTTHTESEMGENGEAQPYALGPNRRGPSQTPPLPGASSFCAHSFWQLRWDLNPMGMPPPLVCARTEAGIKREKSELKVSGGPEWPPLPQSRWGTCILQGSLM